MTTIPQLALNNGVAMPALGFGVFQTPPDETRAAVATALETGYRHIDTAAAYGNERQVGEAIAASGVGRTDIFVETKIWISDHGYDQTLHGFDNQKFGAEHGILTQAWAPIGRITFYRDSGHRSTLDDPAIGEIARTHGKTPAQVMLRWHTQQGRSAIPKSVRPQRIAENFDIFDFELTAEQLAAIDALDTGKRGGPEPADITLANFGRPIPEA
ncbi:aldo/keto reductase [Dactylosporangium sp. CA-139066]|uniref:aldo/keto reductase n=1 Tax=Dactylosporangium sp. CA-139066 TaxID=3239930 RepID=UPI003D907E8F